MDASRLKRQLGAVAITLFAVWTTASSAAPEQPPASLLFDFSGVDYGVVFALLLIYLGLLLGGRHLWVIIPNRHHLETSMARVREQAERAPPNTKALEFLDMASDRLNNDLKILGIDARWVAFTGRQLAAWRLIHNAECLLIHSCGAELLQERAHVTANQLADIPNVARAVVLRKRIEGLLQALEQLYGGDADQIRPHVETQGENGLPVAVSDASGQEIERLLRRLEAVTSEGRWLVFQLQDSRFEELADHQNKALYLIFTAVLILVGISVLIPAALPVLVVGSVGGLLARLRKVMYKRATGFDYGVSWIGVFLAPLVGALTAWSGVLLFHVLRDWHLLTNKLAISLDPPNLNALVVALAFGFSATLFERFMERFEHAAAKPLGGNGQGADDGSK